MTMRRPALTLATLMTLSIVAAGCGDSTDATTETPTAAAPVKISFGIQGTPEELAAWNQVIDEHNDAHDRLTTSVVQWDDDEAARQAIIDGDMPDVFVATRSTLGLLMDRGRIQPVSELLDERGVDFGDRYSRDAVEAFGMHGELQCMAFSVSPTVMFLNTDLVDFEAMRAEGLDTPGRTDRWNLAEFTAAAEYASSSSQGTVGFHIDPTVSGLAPFILSNGGQVIDDDKYPTTLTFSSDGTRSALESSLEVLRNATLTLTEEQLGKRSPLEWFERGKLGMIAGQRDLVPQLRDIKGLNFDVMPMPKGDVAITDGEVTGLCIANDTKNPSAAADLIAHLVGDQPTTALVETGATQPANLAIAGSDVFLQPDQQPENAAAFNYVVRRMSVPPLVDSWADLEAAVAPYVSALVLEPGEIDLVELTDQIDMASAEFFNPGSTELSQQGEDADADEGDTATDTP